MKIIKGLNETIKNFDGGTLKDQDGKTLVVKNLLANLLATSRSSDPARAMAIAYDIYKCDGKIILEDADFSELKSQLEQSQTTNILKAALQKVLKEVENEKMPLDKLI